MLTMLIFLCLLISKVLYLMDVVRNGIRTPNMRLTFTLALFIAKAALQILKPGTTAHLISLRLS